MIQVSQLVKFYGPHQALDHIDLHVPAGKVMGFLGPNGAGKTTTLRILTCYMPPTSGQVTVAGHDVFQESEQVRRKVGYLPENPALYPEMRVREQLHFFGRLHHLTRTQRNARIDELTEACGLSEILDRIIGQLSKGNKQRVGLAMALMHDPQVLILDEPTVGLDPLQVLEVLRLLQELASSGKAVMISTHALSEVEKVAEEVAIIYRGRIRAHGNFSDLREATGMPDATLEQMYIKVIKQAAGRQSAA